jgi:hypothetical protein
MCTNTSANDSWLFTSSGSFGGRRGTQKQDVEQPAKTIELIVLTLSLLVIESHRTVVSHPTIAP